LHNLGLGRKLLLTVAAALAIALPVAFGLFHATPGQAQSQPESRTLSTPMYSSVSIKPSATADGDNRFRMMFSLKDGSFVASGVTLEKLIEMAYHVQGAQISGPGDFLTKKKFNIEAQLAPAYVQQMSQHKGGEDPGQAMLRSILTDQFRLVTRSEAQTLATYDLVTDENGAKLQAADGEQRTMHLGPGEITTSGAPLELLTAQLSARLGRPVVDKTGLKGTYAFTLHWAPDPSEDEHLKQSGEPIDFGLRWSISPESSTDSNFPSLMTALQEQLGLKLQPQNEPVQVLVVDHCEQPSEK
jgi:bla regulator protein blaR1